MSITPMKFRPTHSLTPLPTTMSDDEAKRLAAYEAIILAGKLAREAGLSAIEAMTSIHKATDIAADDPAICTFYETLCATRAEPPDLKDASPQQQKIWRYFRDTYARFHWAPTIRDVANHMGYRSTAPADYHLKHLVAAGMLDHHPNESYAYRLPMKWQ